MPQSSGKTDRVKPAKPYEDFPLFAHATGRWAKKVRGHLHYFGPWRDPQAALSLWLDQRDDLLAGRKPRAHGDGATIRDLCNDFLNAKRHLVDTREITARTFADYRTTTDLIIEAFGRTRLVADIAADDFQTLRETLAKTRGPVALGNTINRVRVVFKFAHDQRLIPQPAVYGQSFKRPSARVLRQSRQRKGRRMFDAAQLRKLIDKAPTQLRAMILLGINAGLGNSDVAGLPLAAVDLKTGWLDYPRPKTAIPRRCKLWPETTKAIAAVVAARPKPKPKLPDDAGLLFVTRCGARWVRFVVAATDDNPSDATASVTDAVSREFAKLLVSQKMKRPGLGFYALRHTFETVAGGTKDQVAVDAIMGHAPASDDMSAVYREGVSDERLVAVAAHVRAWLFPPKKRPAKKRNRGQ